MAKFEGETYNNRVALDLGCGDGVETLALLEAGWHVLAIDSEATAVDLVQTLIPPTHQSKLETRVAAFEELGNLPQADFIYAGYSLPFCSPSAFDNLRSERYEPGSRFT